MGETERGREKQTLRKMKYKTLEKLSLNHS